MKKLMSISLVLLAFSSVAKAEWIAGAAAIEAAEKAIESRDVQLLKRLLPRVAQTYPNDPHMIDLLVNKAINENHVESLRLLLSKGGTFRPESFYSERLEEEDLSLEKVLSKKSPEIQKLLKTDLKRSVGINRAKLLSGEIKGGDARWLVEFTENTLKGIEKNLEKKRGKGVAGLAITTLAGVGVAGVVENPSSASAMESSNSVKLTTVRRPAAEAKELATPSSGKLD